MLSNSRIALSTLVGSEPLGNERLTVSVVRRSPKPENDDRGTFLIKPHVSTANTPTVTSNDAARQRRSRPNTFTYTRCVRDHRSRPCIDRAPSAGTMSKAVNKLQPNANTKADANGANALRALPCKYRNGTSTTAVVSVLPTTAGMMRRVASARPSAVSRAEPSRLTTISASCTRIPTPIPSPASVNRLAGTLNTCSDSAVAAMATAVLPMTSATARHRRSVTASTSMTAPKAIAPRLVRSLSSLANSTLASLLTLNRTPNGKLGFMASMAARNAAAVLIASAPACREISMATAGSPSMRKNRPRESSSARMVASSPRRNTRPPGLRTGTRSSSSSADG